MRTLLGLALLLVAVPTGLSHATLPLNGVANGGFESGWAGWSIIGIGPALIAPGAEATATAVSIPNGFTGRAIHQALPPLVLGNQGVLLDFSARIVNNQGRAGISVVESLTSWNPATGAGQFTAHVSFTGNQVRVSAWTTDPLGVGVGTAAPSDGGWHHYQMVGTGVVGVAALLIDGVPALDAGGMPLLAAGDPASVGLPDRLIVGDVSYCDCTIGAAPDMEFDEIWYGPQL